MTAIETVEVYAVRLPAIRDFSISGGKITSRGASTSRILVRVGAGGAYGWGEATPTPQWTYETVESIFATIERYLAPAVTGLPAWNLDGIARAMDRAIASGFSTGMPLAKSAIDVAVHDLVGRLLGVPVHVLWGQRRTDRVPLGWIVSAAEPAAARDAVAEGAALGYRGFKVKVGHEPAVDAALVAAVRTAAGEQADLWVDANQAYSVSEALAFADAVRDCRVTAFEQPLRANDVFGLQRLHARSSLPIALDESLRHPADLLTFVVADAIDIAIAKVQRNAGLTRSRQLCQLAEHAGLRLMGSGLTDTEVGFAASVQLFAAFGIDRPVDLNGRQFVESAYAGDTTVRVEDGNALLPEGPGLGVDVDLDAVKSLCFDPGERGGR
ncbi:mandelate racemase/muconate lactonizing enzyme family protein [Fodinicola acaciae]|uniref:mandelate racemase/muconate lactonizing enzyme family protein n=1 Tax=Fodinicola acaciae TaxID=2681555 RepID=UPI0013D5CBE8|nr:enolase C-terminal domain-like protein [Fodinicola acaciae]